MKIDVTKVVLAIDAMLVFAIAGLPQLPISDDAHTVVSFILGTVLAGLNVFVPKVSASWRRTMQLALRGSRG